MNRSDFLNIINDPLPSHQTIGEMGELIDLFPYFQSAHLLLLRMLHDSADVKFANQLRKSAIYIANRQVLYNYLSAGKNETAAPTKPEESVGEKTEWEENLEKSADYIKIEEAERIENTESAVETPVLPGTPVDDREATSPASVVQECLPETPATETGNVLLSDNVISDNLMPAAETNMSETGSVIPETVLTGDPPVMNEVDVKTEGLKTDSADVSAGNEEDRHQAVIESGRSSDDLIKEIEEESFAGISESLFPNFHSMILSDEVEDDEDRISMMIIDEEQESSDEKIFYMDPGFSLPETADLLEIESDTEPEEEEVSHEDNSFEIAPEGNTAPEIAAPETSDILSAEEKKLTEADLIDLFISTNPKIEPQKVRSDATPIEDVSKPSAEEKGGFITETLATIYLNQGYYSKAIDIYEKLSLKFPEKSSYFASLIEKVYELIKK